MDTTSLLPLVGGLVTLLLTVLSWLGKRIFDKLDDIDKKIASHTVENGVKYNVLDSRIVRLETITFGVPNGNFPASH